MNSLQSSPEEHDKFQSMICDAIENEPERPHGVVSAAPSTEPAICRRDHFVRNCGQRVDVDDYVDVRYQSWLSHQQNECSGNGGFLYLHSGGAAVHAEVGARD
jgi:hypothetical protein